MAKGRLVVGLEVVEALLFVILGMVVLLAGVYAEEVFQLLVEVASAVHAGAGIVVVGGRLNRHDAAGGGFVLVLLGLGGRGGSGSGSRGRSRSGLLIVGILALF